MNMSIQRDQNPVICPKKKKRDQNLVIRPKERPKLGHHKHRYKCFKIRLEHSHNKRISIRAIKVNREGCQGMIHRVQAWEPSFPWTSFHPDRQSTQPRSLVEGQSGAEVLLSHPQAFCQTNIGPSAADAQS
jgi:hypothetical protein